MADPRPLVLLIDEIDTLVGDALLSVLRQLRAGYPHRPGRTHIDDLANKLREDRVRRVVEPILAGASESAWSTEDVAYVHDLGLVALDDGTPRIANPIYAEVVPRHLNHAVQMGLPQRMAWYVDAEGDLDAAGLIEGFQTFFREHSEHWVQRFARYHEAGPQLLLQAYLQRVVNGGGRIEREYALGRGRVDLCGTLPSASETHPSSGARVL